MVIPIMQGSGNIYSYLRIGGMYKGFPDPPGPQPSANISIYLLMAK